VRYLREFSSLCGTVVLFVIASSLCTSRADVVDFEGFADSTILTTQYSGLTFSNAIILTASVSLNEFEFPPHSGVNVASDNGGPMTIDFSAPITDFGGYFTYLEPLTIDAFDSSSDLVASAVSDFSNNEAISGDPGSSPNEFISVSFSGGVSSVTITGDPGGGSFTLDDATYTTEPATVPEPHTFLFLLPVSILFVTLKSWRR